MDDRDRIACIELPALPLQLLALQHPDWRGHPIAVVASDRPQAELLWVNEHARNQRILPGMRFAAARSLARELRASVISSEVIEACIDDLFGLLLGFSPRIEPDSTQPEARSNPGTLWVDPSGMSLLWGDLGQWAREVHGALAERGFQATVVVGFHRFRCLAIARARASQSAGAWVLPDRGREARASAAVPLVRLGISPRLRDELAGLGVRTLGAFMALPAAELRARFGVEAQRLHARGADSDWAPIQARALVDPIRVEIEVDPPESKVSRLLLRLGAALAGLLEQLGERGAAMSALRLRLSLDHAGEREQHLEPAAPTLDAAQVLELLRLRLDAMDLPAAVERFELELEGQRADPRQIALFKTRSRRDLEAGNRALARVRATLGPEAVTRASLRPAHLPEARFTWIPTASLAVPEPSRMRVDSEHPPRQRRLLARPKALPSRPRDALEGWVIEPGLGPVEHTRGPFRASGGWWVREVERDYYFATTRSGAVLWVFYDCPRRRWYLHGWLD